MLVPVRLRPQVHSYCSLTYKEKQIMETLSFILGIAFVVVIVTAIVAVYAFVKVNKVNKIVEQNEQTLSQEIELVHRTISDNQDKVYRDMQDRYQTLIAIVDSRCDKLENKLYNKK